MIKFYLDHTEFKVAKEAPINDTIIIGGILINHEEEQKLTSLIREIKSRYVNPDLPINYNMRDLRAKFEEHNLKADFEKMLHDSVAWRIELFKRALEIDFKIIIAVIQNFQTEKKGQKDIKTDLLGYSFADLLMRVALEVKTKKIVPAEVISDWPESHNPKPFNYQYYYAYWRGKTPEGHDYFSGTLRSHGFHDTILFASMNHSNMLQFSDLIIGASKDFLSAHLEEREYSIGKNLVEVIFQKFRGFSNNINHGISISSNNNELKNRVFEITKKYFA